MGELDEWMNGWMDLSVWGGGVAYGVEGGDCFEMGGLRGDREGSWAICV